MRGPWSRNPCLAESWQDRRSRWDGLSCTAAGLRQIGRTHELKGAEHYDPQFFTGLESWLKEDSLLLVATDINMPQGQEAILTTDEEVHYAREYLTVKKEQQQRIEEIE